MDSLLWYNHIILSLSHLNLVWNTTPPAWMSNLIKRLLRGQRNDIYQTTHWGRVTHICVTKLAHNWFRQWRVACAGPSHNLNQCLLIVRTLWNIFQWKFNQNIILFIEGNECENVVCKLASILSRPRCVAWGLNAMRVLSTPGIVDGGFDDRGILMTETETSSL